MNTWGHNLRLSIFGESHGRSIGITVDGLPPGEEIDTEQIRRDMLRRAPGRDALSTARAEKDEVEIISGIYNGRTTGFPVCGIISNGDARSGDYGTALRPGHADWTALIKYGGHADMRGGGHFSGRLTAPLVFVGSMARQTLARRGVFVGGRITQIGGIADTSEPQSREEWQRLPEFPVLDEFAAEQMKAAILAAKEEGDSVGGVVEAAAFGLPGGLGEPFFGGVESVVASLLFSVPAVKGVEFGAGFGLAAMRGSRANDSIFTENGRISARTNHSGGILGGITTGMPLIARAAFKPTPSIAKPQQTVDAASMENTELCVKGRHDPCIVPRAVPVVEAAVALGILDMLLGRS